MDVRLSGEPHACIIPLSLPPKDPPPPSLWGEGARPPWFPQLPGLGTLPLHSPHLGIRSSSCCTGQGLLGKCPRP